MFRFTVILALSVSGVVQAAEIAASKLQGNLSVSPMGAATYSIPLSLPAGVNAATPKLSLEYSSQAGMGIAGMGWNIGGLSAITRCPQSKAVDGVQKALTLTADDRFCMDGQRLILTSGTYGAAGSTYQTEINNFARVTALPNPNNTSLIYFKVDTKDGKVLEYGSRLDAVLQPNVSGKSDFPLVWMISSGYDRDQKGQLIAYDYTNDNANGQQTLSRVRYAYDVNNANNLAEVVFTYETAYQSLVADGSFLGNTQYLVFSGQSLPPINKYVSGSLFKKDQTLKSISVKTKKNVSSSFDNNLIYSLTHDIAPNTRNSRLTKVDVCFDNGNCAAPFKITNQDAHFYPDFNNATSINGQNPASIAWADNQTAPKYVVDINNDGYPDMIQMTYNGFDYYINQQGNGFSSANTIIGQYGNGLFPNPLPTYLVFVWNWSDSIRFPRYIVDIDLDGYLDVVGLGLEGVYVNKNNKGNGFLPEYNSFGYQANSMYLTGLWYDAASYPKFMTDINNDGYPDIVIYQGGVSVLLNDKNGGFKLPEKILDNFSYEQGWAKSDTHPRFIVDIDNDGFKDIVGFKDDGVYLSKNNNMVFSSPVRVLEDFGINQGWKNNDEYPRNIVDVNADGYVDIIGFSNDGVQVSLNDGASSFLAKSKRMNYFKTQSGWYADNWYSHKRSPRAFADINNDGLIDIVGFHNYDHYQESTNTYQYKCALRIGINRGSDFHFFTSSSVVAGCSDTPTSSTPDASIYPIYIADMNADGFSDIFFVSPAGLSVSLNRNVGNIDKVTQIEQSFNKSIIEYGVSSNTSLYKKEDATYPNISISTPFYLVKSVGSSNDVGSQTYTDYKYTNMLVDYLRGSKGFKTVSGFNRDTKIKTESVYNQQFPYLGMLKEQRTGYCSTAACLAANTIYPFVAQSGLSVLSSIVNTFENQLTDGSTAGHKIYFPYIKSSTTKTFEPPVVGQ